MSLVLEEHHQYLADKARLSAFEQAIHDAVRPGHVVVDLGAGTGILGLLACRAGASRVYVIEETGIIELSRQIYRANGFADRAVFVKQLSTQAILPERADVVITDQIGRFGFEAGLLTYLADARRRFLTIDGVTVPTRLELWAAPVEESRVAAKIGFWNSRPAGFDFAAARDVAINTGYPVRLMPRQLLGGPHALGSFDLLNAPSGALTMRATLPISRSGTLHGIGGWFVARLTAGVVMTNSPLAEAPIRRRQVCFPVGRPVTVAEGDSLRVAMQILPHESIVSWEVELEGGVRSAHSTFQGMLISAEDLRRTRPDFVPKLSAAGKARETVLALCDGRWTLSEIEREVLRRHPDLFPTAAGAAAFVAEVVTRYAAQ